MKRKTIFLFILFDLMFLGAVGFKLWNRYQVLQGEKSVSPGTTPGRLVPAEAAPPVLPAETPAVPAVTVATVSVQPPPLAKQRGGEKIKRTFIFQSLKAATVELVGDFNQWSPQAFRRKGAGRWELSVLLTPGDYSYNFIVDGKVIRDRNQRRTDAKGRSLMTVAP